MGLWELGDEVKWTQLTYLLVYAEFSAAHSQRDGDLDSRAQFHDRSIQLNIS